MSNASEKHARAILRNHFNRRRSSILVSAMLLRRKVAIAIEEHDRAIFRYHLNRRRSPFLVSLMLMKAKTITAIEKYLKARCSIVGRLWPRPLMLR
jgi:hypothetical protein